MKGIFSILLDVKSMNGQEYSKSVIMVVASNFFSEQKPLKQNKLNDTVDSEKEMIDQFKNETSIVIKENDNKNESSENINKSLDGNHFKMSPAQNIEFESILSILKDFSVKKNDKLYKLPYI